jgi:DNA-binding response OmpR family regulator
LISEVVCVDVLHSGRDVLMNTLLIIDDDLMSRQRLVQIFNKDDFNILEAESGTEALGVLEENAVDIILLDIVMPEMDGFELCAKIKSEADFALIPIIFITALENTEDKVKAFEVGGTDYVTKPFRRAEVLARIRAHMNIKQMEKDLSLKDKQLAVSAMIVTLNHNINNALFALPNWKMLVENKKKERELSDAEYVNLEKMIKQIEYVVKVVRKITFVSKSEDLDKIKYVQYVNDEMMLDLGDNLDIDILK